MQSRKQIHQSYSYWRIVEKVMVAYAAATAILFGACLLFTPLMGLVVLGFSQLDPMVWIGLLGVHGLTLAVTFRGSIENPETTWQPVFAVTPARIQAARWTLAIAVAIEVILLGRATLQPANFTFYQLAFMTLLLSSLCLTIHWGLRPENAYSRRALQIWNHPWTWAASTALRKVRQFRRRQRWQRSRRSKD